MKKTLLAIAVVVVAGGTAFAHCQVPCGIYGDPARFDTLLEHVKTIRKSVAEIRKEAAKDKPDYNQLVRWVNNKEHHADEIKTIAAEYFLAQRIKEGQPKYVEKLKLLHGIIVYAMKTKQSLDPANADTLEKKIQAFRDLYLGPKSGK